MGLFSKKYCEFCGEKLGLFGNTTLKDGYMCKNCARQISHWWSVGKSNTVAEMYEHIMYRNENKKKVEEFRVTKAMGEYYKVLIDEPNGKVMVTSSDNLEKANPDVLDIADITSASYEIDENKSELKTKDEKGSYISYEPKRYEYRYDFYVKFYVKNPYFSTMRFKVNSSYVHIDPWAETEGLGNYAFVDRYTPDVNSNEDYQAYKAMAEEIVNYFAPGSAPAVEMPNYQMPKITF